MRDGWLIYNREDYGKNRAFADRLLGGATSHGLSLRLMYREDICLHLSGKAIADAGHLPAFAVNRSRDWLLSQALQQAGCRVFNSAEACCIGNDKIQSHLLAAKLGLPQVDMAFCSNNPNALVCHGLAYPVVVKDPTGHGGSGVFLAGDEAELMSLAAALPADRVLLQGLCGKPGVDTRIYVMGSKVLAAVRRRSHSDFRANLSLGGAVELCDPEADELEMVQKILAALPLDYAGIDFIYDGQGRPLFNEIEDAVGSRSLYMLGGPDTAQAYLTHIAEVMQTR